jgi:hypothetical protein
MGDTVFINGRAAVHAGSAGKSIAFPDVCLCPPTPPAGPIPTPLPERRRAIDRWWRGDSAGARKGLLPKLRDERDDRR